MRYRLLLFDLDATLLTPERRVHPRVLETLRRLMESGLRVSFATGRSPSCAREHALAVRPNAPLIHFNGAMIRDWESGEVFLHRCLATAVARAALSIAAEIGIHANLYIDEEIYIARRTPVSEASEVKDGVKHTVVGELATYLERRGRDPTKVMLIGDPARFPRFVERLGPELVGACALVNSEPDYLEVLPPGVNKGAAARDLAAIVGITEQQVAAFGDNKNDIEMLSAAGLGVAMGNCHEALRPHADEVIGGCESDAIAVFLERLEQEGRLHRCNDPVASA